jgi:hypothetical protein
LEALHFSEQKNQVIYFCSQAVVRNVPSCLPEAGKELAQDPEILTSFTT